MADKYAVGRVMAETIRRNAYTVAHSEAVLQGLIPPGQPADPAVILAIEIAVAAGVRATLAELGRIIPEGTRATLPPDLTPTRR